MISFLTYCLCRTPPNQRRQAGQSEVVPSTPPEAEQAALADVSPSDLRETGQHAVGLLDIRCS